MSEQSSKVAELVGALRAIADGDCVHSIVGGCVGPTRIVHKSLGGEFVATEMVNCPKHYALLVLGKCGCSCS